MKYRNQYRNANINNRDHLVGKGVKFILKNPLEMDVSASLSFFVRLCPLLSVSGLVWFCLVSFLVFNDLFPLTISRTKLSHWDRSGMVWYGENGKKANF